MEKEAAYFARMEQKEQMEEKMSAQKEIVCDVVSCMKVSSFLQRYSKIEIEIFLYI